MSSAPLPSLSAAEGLSPLPDTLQGYIETLALDSAGNVWMVGWMRRGHLLEFSAVISDRRKTPAAVVLMTYSRDDLPPHACGVIGLISSSWRPTSAHHRVLSVFRRRRPVPSGEQPAAAPAHSPSELAVEYDNMRDRMLGDGRAAALQRILGTLETWGPQQIRRPDVRH